LGVGLAKRGFKTLLIDFDPQASLTGFSDIDVTDRPAVFEWLGIQRKHAAQFGDIVVSISENLDLIPGDISLEEAPGLLLAKPGAMSYLSTAIANIPKDYDYIIIDTSPSLSILTTNALVAADELIVPFKPEQASLKGLELLLNTIDDVKVVNSEIAIAGFLITMFDNRRKAAKELVKTLETIAGDHCAPIYTTRIRAAASGAVLNAAALHKPQNNSVAVDYDKFTDEFLGRVL
jgi:chromosome partitioning protein